MQGIGLGAWVFSATVALCEYRYSTITAWMEMAEDWWATSQWRLVSGGCGTADDIAHDNLVRKNFTEKELSEGVGPKGGKAAQPDKKGKPGNRQHSAPQLHPRHQSTTAHAQVARPAVLQEHHHPQQVMHAASLQQQEHQTEQPQAQWQVVVKHKPASQPEASLPDKKAPLVRSQPKQQPQRPPRGLQGEAVKKLVEMDESKGGSPVRPSMQTASSPSSDKSSDGETQRCSNISVSTTPAGELRVPKLEPGNADLPEQQQQHLTFPSTSSQTQIRPGALAKMQLREQAQARALAHAKAHILALKKLQSQPVTSKPGEAEGEFKKVNIAGLEEEQVDPAATLPGCEARAAMLDVCSLKDLLQLLAADEIQEALVLQGVPLRAQIQRWLASCPYENLESAFARMSTAEAAQQLSPARAPTGEAGVSGISDMLPETPVWPLAAPLPAVEAAPGIWATPTPDQTKNPSVKPGWDPADLLFPGRRLRAEAPEFVPAAVQAVAVPLPVALAEGMVVPPGHVLVLAAAPADSEGTASGACMMPSAFADYPMQDATLYWRGDEGFEIQSGPIQQAIDSGQSFHDRSGASASWSGAWKVPLDGSDPKVRARPGLGRSRSLGRAWPPLPKPDRPAQSRRAAVRAALGVSDDDYETTMESSAFCFRPGDPV